MTRRSIIKRREFMSRRKNSQPQKLLGVIIKLRSASIKCYQNPDTRPIPVEEEPFTPRPNFFAVPRKNFQCPNRGTTKFVGIVTGESRPTRSRRKSYTIAYELSECVLSEKHDTLSGGRLA